MEPTIEALSRFIVEQTGMHWEKFRKPYFLSAIPPDLKRLQVEYKPIIFPDSLKNFVLNSLGDKVKLVSHPTQRAKIGLVPLGQDFDFMRDEDDFLSWLENETVEDIEEPKPISDKDALIQFLATLGKLPNHEANAVVIPTSVLIKLLVGDAD